MMPYSNQYSNTYLGTYTHKSTIPIKINKISTIPYSINSFGFRSQEFYKLDKTKYNILYAGCSNTFGEGLELEDTWAFNLYREISKYKNNSEYFNIGYGAASIHSIIRNVLSFINLYGEPNVIFMHLPNTGRNLSYSKQDNSFVNCLLWDKNLLLKENDVRKTFYINHVEEDKRLFATTLIFMLEYICSISNIKLIWSTWHEESDEFYKTLNFKYFLPINKKYYKKIPNTMNIKNWEFAEDGEHPGVMWSRQFVEQNLNEFIRRGYHE